MRIGISEGWTLAKESMLAFVEDHCLSHGAAMAFYAATSLAPIVLIVVAIAGLMFGREAAGLALSAEVSGLMGPQSAELFRIALESASSRTTGTWASFIGVTALLMTASGVFGEMQSALNVIWKVQPRSITVSRLVKARAVSLGLVASLGFLLLVSLIASAAISAMSDVINTRLPFGTVILSTINAVVSFALISVMFAAIYKILPDRNLTWRDVITGSMVTAALFTVGKSLIGWYIGTSAITSSYGAAGGLLVVLLWVYYSSQIFLFGAELTRAYSIRHGTRSDLEPLVGPQAVAPSASAQHRLPASSYSKDLVIMSLLAMAGTVGMLAARLLRPRRRRGH